MSHTLSQFQYDTVREPGDMCTENGNEYDAEHGDNPNPNPNPNPNGEFDPRDFLPQSATSTTAGATLTPGSTTADVYSSACSCSRSCSVVWCSIVY